MPRPVRRRIARPLLIAIVLIAIGLLRWLPTVQEPAAPATLNESTYMVERVVDGDTLLLTNKARVRLLGVDTPETVKPDHPVEPWGPEATDFTRQFLVDGQVRLELGHERKDDYGRWLAFVWVDDRLLNEELVRAGLSPAVTYSLRSPPMKRRLLAAQAEAEEARRGIWSQPSSR
jgi:micrococcal nuclease